MILFVGGVRLRYGTVMYHIWHAFRTLHFRFGLDPVLQMTFRVFFVSQKRPLARKHAVAARAVYHTRSLLKEIGDLLMVL